VKGGGM
jgi:hypothetical protein